MQYLQVKNIHKSFTDKPVLNGIDFTVLKWQKIALVAKNGSGKSTLLDILTGKQEATDGEVLFTKGVRVGFLTQQTELDKESTVREILSDEEASDTDSIEEQYDNYTVQERELQLKMLIWKLQLTELLHQKLALLSWGEAKRVALAKVLIHTPDFLILDEPTNHLDMDMIEWLEKYLRDSSLTLLMVTHDRYFLEGVCTHIFELDRWKLYMYTGGYDAFLTQKAVRLENEQRTMHNLKQFLRHELERVRKAPRARWTKSVERVQKYYETEQGYKANKQLHDDESWRLEIQTGERRMGGKILKLHNAKKHFAHKCILENFSYTFKQGERIGIIGKNGVGKSTFVQLLMWDEDLDEGSIRRGDTLQIWYYQQKDIERTPEKRVIDVVRDVAENVTFAAGQGKWKTYSAAQLLEYFLFPPAQQHTRAYKLSGGEKRRLHLLTVLMKAPNFLILDEPTNDLDLITITILEEFLLQYSGCLLIISHDRFFMDTLVDHMFVFEGEGRVKDFRWTYSEYKQNKKSWVLLSGSDKAVKAHETAPEKPQQQINSEIHPAIEILQQTSKKTSQKLSYNEKREFEQLGKEIELLEQRKEEINVLFQTWELTHEQIKILGKELGSICEELETKEARWLDLWEKS